MARPARPPIVLKFGGQSLRDPEAVAARIRAARRAGRAVVVIASARAGVTDQLQRWLDGDRSARATRALLRSLARTHAPLAPSTGASLRRLGLLARSLGARARAGPAPAERFLAFGERLAVRWLSDRMLRAGLPAEPWDADALGLRVTGPYGAASIDASASRRRALPLLRRSLRTGRIPVVTGYFGRGARGDVRLLGRGGSDYTATAVAEMLGASRVDLVKPGALLRTGDPRLLAGTRPVHRLSFPEAEELAQLGSRILHPLSVAPVRRARIPIRLISNGPGSPTTRIDGERARVRTRLVVVSGPLRRVLREVPGGRHRAGTLPLIVAGFARAGIPVLDIHAFGSQISFLLPAEGRGTGAAPAVRRGSGSGRRDPPVGLVSVVGDGVLRELGERPGLAPHDALEVAGNSRLVSWLVPWRSALPSAAAVHRRLFPAARARRSARARRPAD